MKKILVKKQKKDELITKEYLDKRLSVTEKNFDNKIIGLDYKINKIDKKLDRTIHYMNLKFDSIEDKLTKLDTIDKRLETITTTLAWLAGEYKKFDEEHTVLSEQNNRTNDTINNHEERISRLEQRVVTP